MRSLQILAGPRARQHLAAHGLRPADVRAVPAAAGGPKGLVLTPIDRFLFGHWLRGDGPPVHLVGASIGAWRIDYKVWEFCHVLSGRCVIELEGCAPVTLAAGDTFIIEPGAKGKWTVLEDMKKNFVILVPAG